MDSQAIRHSEKHRKAENLLLSEIRSFLTEQGYEVVSITQPWRHVGAHIRKNGEDYFLKLASTPSIAERTRNEIAWNKGIREIVNYHPESALIIPPVLEEGTWQSLTYYITHFYSGRALFSDNTQLPQDITRVVSVTKFIASTPSFPLPSDNPQVEAMAFHLEKTAAWLEEIDTHQAIPDLHSIFFHYRDELLKNYLPQLQHGDFVPGHLLESEHGTVLLDGEAARTRSCAFYDAAYFYHRLFTKSGLPEAAHLYYKTLLSELNAKDQENCRALFPGLLATRTIAGFRDYFLEDGTSLDLHIKLLKTLKKGDSLD